jgi:ABC-2 type transport system ATP-binding protein
MKRRLLLAKALVHMPPILVLDEPTAGVDVELRQMLWQRVRELNRRGMTILLTTHYLEEAEELCDRIAIINHGRIIVDEDKSALLARIDNKEIRFTLDRDITAPPPGLEAFQARLSGSRTLTVHYAAREAPVAQILTILQQAGIGVADLTTQESSLEDVFLRLTRAA